MLFFWPQMCHWVCVLAVLVFQSGKKFLPNRFRNKFHYPQWFSRMGCTPSAGKKPLSKKAYWHWYSNSKDITPSSFWVCTTKRICFKKGMVDIRFQSVRVILMFNFDELCLQKNHINIAIIYSNTLHSTRRKEK